MSARQRSQISQRRPILATSNESAAHHATHADHYEPPSQGIFVGGVALTLMIITILFALLGVYLALT